MDDQKKLPGMDRTPQPEDDFDDTDSGYVGAPHARTKTSKDGAKKVRPKVRLLRQLIWEFVHSQGSEGATPFEAAARLELCTNTAGPRFPELRGLGRVIKTKDTRPTYNGGKSRVYVAIEPEDWTDKRKGWPAPEVPNKVESLRLRIKGLVEALVEIERGEGEFSRDPLTHAVNTIDSMRQIARNALHLNTMQTKRGGRREG